jgi:hypothetical protein
VSLKWGLLGGWKLAGVGMVKGESEWGVNMIKVIFRCMYKNRIMKLFKIAQKGKEEDTHE